MSSWEIVYKATSYIAEEMGVALKKSAMSPNIRERMDHSCAIVDEEGRIVAQAEHIPVHLGSFKVCVKNILEFINKEGIKLEEGDSLIFNDPYISGTHLNDVTLISPIYIDRRLVGYTINKAHQVDVGGSIPGSLNPYAKTLFEEGFVIPPVKFTKKGVINEELVRIIKENFKMPEVSLGDLFAQLAANKLGQKLVSQLIEKYGLEKVKSSWEASINYGEELTKIDISNWKNGVYEAEDYLEINDELVNIRISLKVMKDKIIADFSGSHKQVESPLNAVLGVTFSAVSFAVRCMISQNVPTNQGFYNIIEITAPEGSIVNPIKPVAVGAGNVETSQRIADVTFKALAQFLPVPAAGSGTMMNIMLGGIYKGKYWSYYETIGGGTGGRPNKDGVSGVHVNMTNTLNTPIEIAERYYPILFTKYLIREGSGGNGKFKGGDGIIRGYKFLEKVRVSVIAERFKIPPWGLNGGEAGKPGRAYIVKKGKTIEMSSKFSVELEAGDELVVETPGGGGYGKKEK
jgi:N-methylhydantoinase B